MSYSSEVKKELANIELNDCCSKAFLYGIIRYKSNIILTSNGLGIEIVTMHNAVARKIIALFKKIYNVNLEIIVVKREKLDKKNKYVITLFDNCKDILIDLKLIDANFSQIDYINKDLLKNDCCKRTLLRSIFMIQGSCNNPMTNNYHLEIVLNNEYDIAYIQEILNEIGVFPKYIEREKGFVLYLKKSEQIGDFLNYIGAVNSMLQFEDNRIKKDYNNYVNRIINCDIANEQKAIISAQTQLNNIKFLTDNIGLVNLSDRLTDAIILRTSYPDYSLNELSSVSEETIGRFISKSGLSHCFKDIEIKCLEIKKNRNIK